MFIPHTSLGYFVIIIVSSIKLMTESENILTF